MKNLERAVRLFRALVETGTDVQVTSSTLWSWPETAAALSSADGDPSLLVEMEGLSPDVRNRTLRYAGSFAPLEPKGDVYVFPNVESADKFVAAMEEDVTAVATHLADGIVSAYGETQDIVMATAAKFGGTPWDGPSLVDAFESVDTDLPYLMIQEGFDPREVETALIESLWKEPDQALNEAFFMHAPAESPKTKFRGRLARWAVARPVFGVDARLFEALRMSGALPSRLCALVEADPAAPGAPSPASPGAATAGGQPASGATGATQPDPKGGQPAQSQSAPDKEAPKPTEHVPTQEEGGTTVGQVKLPDGTVVPPDVMKQALAKMLHNLATQVEQGTMGGKPAAKPADQGAQQKQGEPPEVEPKPTGQGPDQQEPKAEPQQPQEPAEQQPQPAAAGQQESITEDLHRALGLLKSPRPRDVIAGVGMVKQVGFSGQPQSVVERVLDEFNALKGSPNARVRRAVNDALDADLYRTTNAMIPVLPEGLNYGKGVAAPGTPVVIVEDRGSRLVLRLPTGETVLAPASAVALVEASGRRAVNEATREQVGDSVLGPKTFNMNVATISGADARRYAERLYGEADDADLDVDLPNLDRNFALLKSKMRYAKTLRRQDMPVIDPKDIPTFGKRLQKGYIDLFEPYADVEKEWGPQVARAMGGRFPTWQTGMRGGSAGRVWVGLGRLDGSKPDDMVPAKIEMIPVKSLKPLQNEIWYDKLVASILKWGVPQAGGHLLTNAIIIVSREGYILDGHHRFGQAMLADPNLKIKGLRVDLDIDTLLKVGLSYGAALGNEPRESYQRDGGAPMIQGQGRLYDNPNPFKRKLHHLGESLDEQLDVGQDDEKEATATGFASTAGKLKQCRRHTFDLVTKDLVQLESLAKAVGAKRTMKLLAQTRDKATDFLDALKETAELLDKANEAYKSEGGKGGDQAAAEQQAAAAPAAPGAPAPAPAAPAAPAPAPAVAEALRRIAQTTIPRRIAAGESYSTVTESIRHATTDLALSKPQVAEVYDKINALALHDDGTPEFSVELSSTDHRLLESVQRHGGLVRGLVQRTARGQRTLATRTELREAASILRKHGRVEHGMLAEDLEAIVSGAC